MLTKPRYPKKVFRIFGISPKNWPGIPNFGIGIFGIRDSRKFREWDFRDSGFPNFRIFRDSRFFGILNPTLVRTSSCSSAAHLFIFELFVPILAQVLLIKNGSYLFLLMCCSIDGTVTKPDCFQFPQQNDRDQTKITGFNENPQNSRQFHAYKGSPC